jgi:hypothetical protein
MVYLFDFQMFRTALEGATDTVGFAVAGAKGNQQQPSVGLPKVVSRFGFLFSSPAAKSCHPPRAHPVRHAHPSPASGRRPMPLYSNFNAAPLR